MAQHTIGTGTLCFRIARLWYRVKGNLILGGAIIEDRLLYIVAFQEEYDRFAMCCSNIGTVLQPVLVEVVYVNRMEPQESESPSELMHRVFDLRIGDFELASLNRTYTESGMRLYTEMNVDAREQGINLQMTSRRIHIETNVYESLSKAHDFLIDKYSDDDTHSEERPMGTAMTLTESNTRPELATKKLSPWTVKAANKINAIHNLRPNWDSYGALRPNSLSLQHAAVFVHLLWENDVAEPLITPNAKGNVCFEWSKDGNLSEASTTTSCLCFGMLVP